VNSARVFYLWKQGPFAHCHLSEILSARPDEKAHLNPQIQRTKGLDLRKRLAAALLEISLPEDFKAHLD
jgi:hypothetical protein